MGKKGSVPGVQRKKSWEVVKASQDKFTGLGLEGGKFRKFGKSGAFVTHDAGEARYIEEAFGSHSKTGDGSVVVCEVDNAGTRLPRKVFIMPAMPWKENKDGDN
jgi:hypothetical protein